MWPNLEARYETRLVAYFDALGWKDKIERANSSPVEIGKLRAFVQLFSIFQHSNLVPTEPGALLTSFSDNVVVSVPFKPEYIPSALEGIGRVQLGAAAMGFFIRGAVTIGDIFHDREALFGPALNRAYEIESKIAKNPRIILDPVTAEFQNLTLPFVTEDDGHLIVDPFTIDFFNTSQGKNVEQSIINAYLSSLGMNKEGIPQINQNLDAKHFFGAVVRIILSELSQCATDTGKEKLSWLLIRLSEQLVNYV